MKKTPSAIERFDSTMSAISVAYLMQVEELTRLRSQLWIAITGMTETIEDNLHLADGDNCTLIKLKQALAAIRELEK